MKNIILIFIYIYKIDIYKIILIQNVQCISVYLYKIFEMYK